MPENSTVGRRHVQRLASGVWRARIVDPVLAARPALLVASAPSGYGKTVFAAQVASDTGFDLLIWIDAMGTKGSLRETLLRLCEGLSIAEANGEVAEPAELAEMCGGALATTPDSSRIAIVLDDVGWELGPDVLDLLQDIVGEAPLGSMMIVTTRAELACPSRPGMRWDVHARDLLLDSNELASLWQSVAGLAADASQLDRLAYLSGGHAALALLQVRQSIIARPAASPPRFDADVAAVVRSLVRQLDDSDRRVLHVASVIGDGNASIIGRCVGGPVKSALRRVADVLPLVSLSNESGDLHFSVHALLTEALESAGELARSDMGCLAVAVAELAEAGRYIRAVEVAGASGDAVLLSEALGRVVDPVVIAEHQESLRESLSSLSAVELAGSPAALLLHALLLWESGSAEDAIQATAMAATLAEHCADSETHLRARVASLRMRAAAGELQGLATDVREMQDSGLLQANPEAAMLVATAGMLAFGLLGDRPVLSETESVGRSLLTARGVTPITRSRFNVVQGVARAILDGAFRESAQCFSRAISHLGSLTAGTALTWHDRSVALLEAGAFDEAADASARASQSMGSEWPEGLRCLPVLTVDIARVAVGEHGDPRAALDKAFEYSAESGDWLSATLVAELGARSFLLIPDVRAARSMAERAVEAALHTGSPVLLWMSELAQAQVRLATGDRSRAEAVAERILAHAEPLGAWGHVLRARLLLAELAMGEGDLARATEHLGQVPASAYQDCSILTLGSYIRTFPALLGPLALVVGVNRFPDGLLEMLRGPFAAIAMTQAEKVLSRDELALLKEGIRPEQRQVDGELSGGGPICHVRLFGGLEVTTPRGKVGDRDWTKRKARLLFAMLVSRFGTDVPRGEIVDYLWPEMEEERSLNNFYVVWSAMKRALSPDSVRDTPSPFVEHVHGVCRIVREHVVSDLDEFKDLLTAARNARDAGDDERELKALREAESIYRGDILPGDVYDDWFATVRDRYRHDFEDAMLRLAQLYLDRNEPHDGLAVLRKVTMPEMWREDLFQALLRLQIAAGQRSAAIETYMRCRARLTEDLGIDPSRETTALYEQVLGMEERADLVAD